MKKIITFLASILLIIIIVFISMRIINNNEIETKYFTKQVLSSIPSLVNNQYSINNKLDKVSDDKSYTISNPYIELNPYKISPLSAIIIFQTNDSKEISLSINDKYETKMELSTKHIVPIYG